jgi:hypothetical protein
MDSRSTTFDNYSSAKAGAGKAAQEGTAKDRSNSLVRPDIEELGVIGVCYRTSNHSSGDSTDPEPDNHT